MLKSLSSNKRTVFDIVNIVAGLGLFLSPWYLGYAGEAHAAWHAWIVGGGIALIAGAALYAFHEAEEWANVALGIWAALAPWVIGFAGLSAAMTAHIVFGAVVAIMAGASLWFINNRPLSTA